MMGKKKNKQNEHNLDESAQIEVDSVEGDPVHESDQPTTNKWEKLSEEATAVEDDKKDQLKEGLTERSRESLENELIDLRTKITDSKDMVLRTQAEMQNLRTRLDRDMSKARKFANEKLVGELLPIVDSLLRGKESVSEDNSAREGIELTHTMLMDLLKKHGVLLIAPQAGELFSPEKHEAMSMVPVEGATSNTVIEVLQMGFELNGRVLRAAMVVVAK